MNILAYIVITFLLSLVPFSVALSSSVYRCIVWKEAFRIGLVFALVQAIMIILGWLIGFAVKGMLYSMATPVAAFIIFLVGARIFLDAVRLGREQRTMAVENNRILLGFAFVTSINTLLLGMGMGIIYKEPLVIAGLMAGMVFFLTIIGIQAGKRGMMNLGRTAESLSGAGLVMISIVIVLQYLKIF